MSFRPLIEKDLCICGSGEPWWRLYDACGIYCGRCCDVCERDIKAKYRPEVFNDPNYETNEPKEPE